MPNIRCKWYGIDGTPIRGGCPVHGCRFIHPGQKGWDSLHSKIPVRCMFFDLNGVPIRGGCRNRNCRFTHPNDPDWEVAPKSRPVPERSSDSFAGSSAVPRSTQPDYAQRARLPKETTDARQSPTETMGHRHIPSDPRISRPLKISTTEQQPLAPSISREPDVDLTTTSPSTPHLSSTSSQPITRKSSVVPASALSESTDDHSRQVWKRRIILLDQAHNLIQKLSEIDADIELRIALQSTDTSFMAPSAGANLETLKDSPRDKQMNLESKLNSLISQLIKDDPWPLPTTKQSDTSVNRQQPQLSASLAELGRLLDIMETKLNQIGEIAKSHRGHVSIEQAQDEGALPPSKRRRISSKRSSQVPINFQEILRRLDCLQGNASELVEEKLFDGRLLEHVDERVEAWLLEKPVARPLQPDDLIDDAVQEVDTDLDTLCNELADLDTDDLVSQIGALRLETGNLKQTMESLASDQQALQRRQASLDQQTRKIIEELPELQMLSQVMKYNATDCDKVVGEVKDEIQEHIDAECTHVHGAIKSYHEEIKQSVFALLEPTVVKTETLYRHVHSRTDAEQH